MGERKRERETLKERRKEVGHRFVVLFDERRVERGRGCLCFLVRERYREEVRE